MWHCYWYLGDRYPRANALAARLAGVRDRGWVHHIPRLMVLGDLALQRGWDPVAVTDRFTRCFVDGYPWVMTPNAVGMSLYAAGYRAFLHRNRGRLAGNHRMAQPLVGLGRLDDIDDVVRSEAHRRSY